jgi:Fe-S-cluster containining protein
MPDYPSVVIEFGEFDLIVPLICRRCGNCCRSYYVPIDIESLPEIAEIMGEPIYSIQDRLNECLERYRKGSPGDCCFLAESSCRIHTVKPEACRQFPSFTDAAAGSVDCPAHKEHKIIERGLCSEYREFQIRLPSSLKKPRSAPQGEWGKIMDLLEKADASALFIQTFLNLNKAQDER